MNKLRTLNILYLEDEELIRANITEILKYMFQNVYEAIDYEDAVNKFSKYHVDIILSDISMSGKNGLDFIKYIRNKDKYLPVILLTAHTDTTYLLEAVKLHLIDYLRKPVNLKELRATLLKASEICNENGTTLINFENGVQYNIEKKELLLDDKIIDITKKEMLLLEFLIKNKNRTISKEEIQNSIWEDSIEATESAFKSLMNKLRKKIGKNSIKNFSKVGYKIYIEN